MANETKRKVIRDPICNIIEFPQKAFEQTLWKIVQTSEFQRLRRIKQLGFSELVYPGATHTRFSHSLGVFHVASRLMSKIKEHLGDKDFVEEKGRKAITAALLHDIGHGPFSHAFEDVGRRLKLSSIDHEAISIKLIEGENGEISKILKRYDSGFAKGVAEMVREEGNVYKTVFSSQFDADRLDYMQRDRFMTGTALGNVDMEWLLLNLEIGELTTKGEDGGKWHKEPTFVVGEKGLSAVESYVLNLFHLYKTVYFHKTTRGMEKIFTELMCRIITLVREKNHKRTNLPKEHPLVLFSKDPDSLENFLGLDDFVIWGSLSMMAKSEDRLVSEFSDAILNRKPWKCEDVGQKINIEQSAGAIIERVNDWNNGYPDKLRVLLDKTDREPYKVKEGQSPLNHIWIKKNEKPTALPDCSETVGATKKYEVLRLYYRRDDDETKNFIEEELYNGIQR